MKRYSLGATLVLALCLCGSLAQARNEMVIKGLRIVRQNDQVVVSFDAEIDRRTVSDDQTLNFTPVLCAGSQKARLPITLVIRSNRASISASRRQMTSGRPVNDPRTTIVTGNGGRVSYRASVPYQDWMEGASLRLDRVMRKCCSEQPLQDVMLAENVLRTDQPAMAAVAPAPAPAPQPAPAPAPVVAAQPAPQPAFVAAQEPLVPYLRRITTNSAGCDMAARLPFIMDRANLGKGSINTQDMTENSLVIYFRRSNSVIDSGFWGNDQTLRDLVSAINSIDASADSKIATIFVVGFASLEGSFKFNEALAMRRALALKTFILQNTRASSNSIMLYNGAEDWDGLRRLVAASDMPRKAEVLRIIDTVPIWDAVRKVGREGELMRLGGGGPYRYMLTNFFPKLRNATYVRVVFEACQNGAAATINRGIDQIQAGDFTGALATLNPVSNDPRALNPIGACYMMTGDLVMAKKFFDKAIAAGSDEARANLDQMFQR